LQRTAAIFYNIAPRICVVICGRHVSRVQLRHYHQKVRAWEVGPISEMANFCGPASDLHHTFLTITVLPAGIITAIPHGEVNQIPAAARVLDSSVLGLHMVLRAKAHCINSIRETFIISRFKTIDNVRQCYSFALVVFPG